MRHRWIELFPHDYFFWKNFSETQKSSGNTNLSYYLTDENQDTVVGLVGLPFSAEKSEIIDFMAGFSVDESDIVIGKRNGRATGKALVFLKNSLNVRRAEDLLDMKYMGQRYIQVKCAKKWSVL